MKLAIPEFCKSSFFKRGLPFFIICIGGSFGLKGFTSLRYEYSNKSSISREDFEKEGIKMKPPTEVTLEAEYEKLQTMDIDNWENVRGPRPWEEGSIEENRTRSKK
ncbi:cytochrome c oxidase assembly protein COX16 homolog, mitochondrial [Coccinella septempunctata]|uniref:cytochrome c oxidase assembly protein COX16 homolog, mitochondrial n=1 Tax=Coccinella septempunctata TaxID=41139 RepID=UPI001D074871|nr:cytochrome c oxidase assembly protein COX16 homolog, mitochondrial [Coccinella septempunctata]